MKISTPQLHLMIKLLKVEAKKNPHTDVDELLDVIEKAVTHRTQFYKNGLSHDGENTMNELKKIKEKRDRKLRPQPEVTDYHPLSRSSKT